jgi:gliding motility-associated-like protein/uncharacterized repeat protein (TIGR01451 family)
LSGVRQNILFLVFHYRNLLKKAVTFGLCSFHNPPSMSRFFTIGILSLFLIPLSAQNFNITYQTPDQLVVCEADTLRITVQNTSGTALSDAQLTVLLPAGLSYVPGTIAGATETSLADPLAPVFGLGVLPPNQVFSLLLRLQAGCELIGAINGGQTFAVSLRLEAGALEEQVQTAAFPVETSLLVITQVDNDSVSGEKGDMILRTLHVQNTRLGAVRHMVLRDTHQVMGVPGYVIDLPGAVSQTTLPTGMEATFDGTFFTAFGDGDDLLEFGETALVTEKITITDCGIPERTFRSDLRVSWSCTAGAPACQVDSAYADLVVLKSTYLPLLQLYTSYGLPWDYCGEAPSTNRMIVVNTGPAPATGVLLQVEPLGGLVLNGGLDPASFRVRTPGGFQPVPVSILDSVLLPDCGQYFAHHLTMSLPDVPANDTLEVWFDTYFCAAACEQPMPNFRVIFFGKKECPENGFDVIPQVMTARVDDRLLAYVKYDLGDCLQDGQTYNFDYVLESDRLQVDSGFVWLRLDLPLGLSWSDDCPVQLGGKAPAHFAIDSSAAGLRRLLMAFELPLSADSLSLPFCLQNTCGPGAAFVPVTNLEGPDANGDFVVYHSPAGPCSGCGYRVQAAALLTRTLDTGLLDCAVPMCDSFQLRTSCPCPDDPGPNPGDCPRLREYHQAYRTNFGLADSDDNRIAEPGVPVDPALIRRDRFLPGDTLQAVLSTKVVCGDSIEQLFYQVFTETTVSDFYHAGADDVFDIGPAPNGSARAVLVDQDSFQLLDAVLTLWDSSASMVYTCPLPAGPGGASGLYGLVAVVNTKPPVAQDELATMHHDFTASLPALSSTGCIPPGFLLEAGDSAALTVNYRLAFNFTPICLQHKPPLINFEMGFNGNQPPRVYSYRTFDTLMMQYSGFEDTVVQNLFGIRPCTSSTEIRPFYYDIRLARPNLFPFEVRPLSNFADFTFSKPAGVTPLSVMLQLLSLQGNVPLFQNQPIDYDELNGGELLDLDFSPFFSSPPDEGYQLRTAISFAPACGFKWPAAMTQNLVLDYYGNLPPPDPDTISLLDLVGYQANHPLDTIITDETVLEFPTPVVAIDVMLINQAPVPAPDYWIRLESPDGGLTDFTLQLMPLGLPVLPAGSIFPLGTLGVLEERNLRIQGLNLTCSPQRLWIIYGFDCEGLPGITCESDTLEVLLIPQNPELELEVVQFPQEAPLCDTSDYVVLELSNAALGNAYDPFVTVQLPPGFQLLPGSAQVSYPAGSIFLNAGNPAHLGDGLYQWSIGVLQSPIAINGLPGVNLSPQNALRLRFKLVASCGVVSNAQLIFGARGKWSCGDPTNVLSKASDPLPVEGLVAGYDVAIAVTEQGTGGPLGCSQTRTVQVSLQIDGSPQAGDSIVLMLPPGFGYVQDSYQPGANAPAGPPTVSGQRWQLAMPQDPPGGAPVTFTLQLLTPGQPDCATATLIVQSRETAEAFCPVIGADCDVYVATGESEYTFYPPIPGVSLEGAVVTLTANGQAQYSASFTNPAASPIALSVLEFYRDVDGDGTLSTGDTLVFSLPLTDPIPPGPFTASQPGGAWPGLPCTLLAVLPAVENCACATQVVPVKAAPAMHALTACAGAALTVGVDSMPGQTYQWSGAAGLPCATCSSFDFVPPVAGTYQFTLIVNQTGGDCAQSHQFTIQAGALPVIVTPPASICPGETVQLQTSAAVAWQWSGPGIVQPAAPAPVVQPAVTGLYTVTATTAAGCTGVDSVLITVWAADSVDLGLLRTCEGTPVEVFGQMTDQPGYYSQILSNANGCDSVVYLRVEVVGNTEELLERCPGDTLLVFGEPVTTAGSYCREFTSSLGCDSMHCVVVNDLPELNFPEPEATYVELGESATLEGPPGQASYAWTPATYLNCTDCPNPEVTPADSLSYLLTVTSAAGCNATVLYRVLLFPPCDAGRLEVPNAFTPDGDGLNDVFRVVPYEGVETVGLLVIYDRWGQRIYEGSGTDAAWDGATDGEPAPSESYVYMVEIRCDDGASVRWGQVTLLR